MSTLTFNILSYAKKLEACKFTKEQTDVLLDIFQDFQEKNIKQELATKMDLESLQFKLRLEIEKNKSEIIRWMIGLIIALATFLKAF
ncbi:MAG: hypothetical protein J5846_02205 [Desulfovibrio sp.]|nr:hypothetical protein [Desulfovibrio sp.]